MRFALLLFTSACIWAPQAFAQAKVYGTSGMDRGQAGIARLQAQQAASAKAIRAIAQCGNAGHIYGPGFGGPKTGNCPNSLTIRTGGGISVSDGANIAGDVRIAGKLSASGTSIFGNKVTVTSGGAEITGNATLHNNLTVSGTAAVDGLVTANKGVDIHGGWLQVHGNYGTNFADHGGGWYMSDGTWLRSYGNKSVYTGGSVRADNQFQIGTSVFGPPPVCNVATQKLYWNNGWSCKTTIGGAGAGETDPQIGTLGSGKWCYSNGNQVVCNITPPPACNASNSKLRWTGSVWECVSDGLGTHTATANLNMANHAITSSAGTLRDANGGWVRTYGTTGWYNQTYGGGWYMTDGSWLRAYGNKGIYTTGQMNSGSVDTGSIYNSGNSNVNDIYVRAAGKWASQIAASNGGDCAAKEWLFRTSKYMNEYIICPKTYNKALVICHDGYFIYRTGEHKGARVNKTYDKKYQCVNGDFIDQDSL